MGAIPVWDGKRSSRQEEKWESFLSEKEKEALDRKNNRNHYCLKWKKKFWTGRIKGVISA